MIEGVKIKKLVKHCDDRGFFAELVRNDEPELLSKFGQASWSMTYPGVIKAFHYHEKQDDLWFFPSGSAQVVLYDMRENSQTQGKTEVYYMGDENPIMLLIPKGVAHGYRVLGKKPATIIYFTTESYNPKNPDEKRISWNDPMIGFNWETMNR
jgi:dTDP-4-dehydrorhamnose 3,5-epimerase